MNRTEISTEQKTKLLRAYGRQKSFKDFFSPKLLKAYLILLFWSLLLVSLPFVLLFLLASHYIHDATWSESIKTSLLALWVGPALFIILLAVTIRSEIGVTEVEKEINEGICYMKKYSISRIYKLVDDGDFTNHDYIAVLSNRKAFVFTKHDVNENNQIRNNFDLYFLPKSKISFDIKFYGELIDTIGTVESNYLFRNDDLAYLTPINPKNLTDDVKSKLNL